MMDFSNAPMQIGALLFLECGSDAPALLQRSGGRELVFAKYTVRQLRRRTAKRSLKAAPPDELETNDCQL